MKHSGIACAAPSALRRRVLFVAFSAILGCSASQATTPSAGNSQRPDVEATYAAGLEEAFEIYSDEIYTAALFDYASSAEADAVVRTLSTRHFDQLLARSLAKRGLSVNGLAHFAEEHATFFHEQQRRHWGKMQDLEAVLASIPLRVRPAPVDDSMIAFD
ncbi:MAG: hypothetical protein QM778_35650 [Myxococcales bacterium]